MRQQRKMLDRRAFLGTLGLLAAPCAVEAQPAGKVARIGILTSGSPATSADSVDAFRQRLRELGYLEGRNLAIEVRHAGTESAGFRTHAAELVGLGVEVIVAANTLATRAAKERTSTIPIVMVTVGDAVGAGLVKSLPRPGGNVTGHSFLGPELALKGFDLLTEALPRTTRLAVLFNPEITPDPLAFPALRPAAQAKGIALKLVALRRPDDVSSTLAAMGSAWPNALLVFAVSSIQQNQIVGFAAKNRLPALFGFREAVDAGGLMSFGPSFIGLWRGAATYVDKILNGAKPADLPIEQPTKFELVINLKTAKAFGLTIPPSLLQRADQVIDP